MSAVSEALMRRIGKIKALAERGIDGERAAAQSMLENILARHNLTMGDLEEARPNREWVEVSFSGKHERSLMTHVILKVRQEPGSFQIRQRKRARSSYSVELSSVEHVEVEFVFALMRKALAEEMDKVLSAFIFRNDLYGQSPVTGDDKPRPEQTPEERARLRQIAAMSEFMNPVNVRKAITA